MTLLSVVVPVFDEVDGLDELHDRVGAALDALDYELVLVDDGSRDGSWKRMCELAAADPRLRLVRLSRNFGHQIAITAGLDAARGDAVVIMDADLQDPPELIPALLERWQQGYDVVYAVRSERAGESAFKLMTAKLFYRLLRRLAGIEIPPDAGDFRLLSRPAADAIGAMPERARFLRGMTSWIGYRQTGVEYARSARFAGETKYSTAKMLRFAADAVLSFSTVPIRVVSSLGLVLVVFCAGYLAYVVYLKLFTHATVQGWTSVIVIVLLLGGMQLISLGLIGQYIGRIFEEVKRRPLYLVAEIVDGKRTEDA